MKKIVMVIVTCIVMVSLVVGYKYITYQQQIKSITTFNACAKQFPVMESYPAQCRTPDGRSFTQNIGNALEYADEIIVESPRPNQMLMSAFPVRGKARGTWFFEGSFSGELFDANGNSLGTVVLQTQEDWMTTAFVNFTGQLIFAAPQTDTGILRMKNDNPSGLPEKQKELDIPVIF